MTDRRMLGAIILFALAATGAGDQARPVVLWHGMGDSCFFDFSMGAIKRLIQEELPGVYLHCIRTGHNEFEDVGSGYFGNVNEQISEVCSNLSNIKELSSGFNAIGFSQGGQFLRAVAQRCGSELKIKNLISMGGQHQGVYGFPNCGLLGHRFCDSLRRVLTKSAYLRGIQETLVQATYWHDPIHEQEYRENSLFLADINNEININQTYKENLSKLNKLVLVKFNKDTMVTPPDSEWFGFYEAGQSEKISEMIHTDLYKEDKIGLRLLNESGRLDLLSIDGKHLQFSDEWFISNIINKYLR